MTTMIAKKELHTGTYRLNAPLTEFSNDFVQGMANRMAVSYFKYGPVADGYPARISALSSLRQRIERYLETGNTEFLVDVANFALIEYMHPSVRGAHFQATDSDASPGRTLADGTVSAVRNDEAVPFTIEDGEEVDDDTEACSPTAARAVEVVGYVEHFSSTRGYPPTMRQIAGRFEVALSTAHKAVSNAIDRGLLEQVPNVSRTLRVTPLGRAMIAH